MAIPKLKQIIEQVHREGSYDLSTLEGCGAFTRACAMRVYEADSRIVMLKKSASRTHVVDAKGRRHAADALLFLENGKGTSIDIIGKSRTADAKPSWTPDSVVRYTTADGFVPDYDAEMPPAEDPPAQSGEIADRVAALERKFAALKAALAMALFLILPLPSFAQQVPPCLIDTPAQRAIWDRMKVEKHVGYQQILQNTVIDRYNDIGRWELDRYVIDRDPIYGRKSFEEVKATTHEWTVIFAGNESREYMIELAMMYGCLKPIMSPADDAAYKGWLVAVADKALAGLRPGDSDQAVGNYFGWAVLDKVAGTDYLSRSILDPTTGKPLPVGGLTATGANYASVRNAVRLFAEKMAAGGNWPESSEYNLGSTLLLYMGAYWTGIEHFPEVAALVKQHAIQQMHEVTPNLKDSFQWGDVEKPHQLDVAVHLGDLWSALANVLTPVAPSLASALRGFEDAVFAANSYTRNPLYARTYYWFDPYAPRSDWKALAGNFLVTPGMGMVYWREGCVATMVQFPNWTNGAVDHMGALHHGDVRVADCAGFPVDHPQAYMPDPKLGNQVLVNGTGPSFESGGLLATKYEPGRYAYAAGSNAGVSPLISVGDYVNVPIYLHENTRQIVQLFGGPELVLIIADRVHGEDVKTQTITNQWGTFGFEQFYTYENQKLTFSRRFGIKDWVWHTPVTPTLTPTGFTWNDVTVTRVFPADIAYRVVNEATETTLGGYINASERKFAVHGVPAAHRDFDLFLHVISTGAVTATLVDQGDRKGVTITRGGQSQTVLFGAVPGPKMTLVLKNNVVAYDVTKINAIAPFVSVSINGVEIPTPLRPVDAPPVDGDPVVPPVDPPPPPPIDPPPPPPTNICGYAITPSTILAPAIGGELPFTAGPYLETCAAPVFISGASTWLTVTGSKAIVQANLTTQPRSAVIAVGGDVVGQVTQAGASVIPTPDPPPAPPPPPPPSAVTCVDDDGSIFAVNEDTQVQARASTRKKIQLKFESLGWRLLLPVDNTQKPYYYMTFRCVGK